MGSAGSSSDGPARPGGGLIRYAATWVVAGAVVSVLAIIAIHAATRRHAQTAFAVPPVRQIALGAAARNAGCRLSHRAASGPPLGSTAAPGVSGRPLTGPAREAALRRGLIVIEYRDVDDPALRELRALQATVPAGTLLAPGAAARGDQLTVSSYYRRLACARMTPAAVDALRLFRGRYMGAVSLP